MTLGGRWVGVVMLTVLGCGGGDGKAPDAGDAGADVAAPVDAGALDAAVDGGRDGGADAAMDAGVDGGRDGGADAALDAGPDAAADAGMDGGVDAGMDGGVDAGMDGGVDGGADGGIDAGAPACPPVRVTNDGAYSNDPVLVYDGTGFAVAWSEERDGNGEIYFARLDLDGAVVGSELRVTDDTAASEGQDMVWTGSEYGLVWYDQRDGAYEIYFTRVSASGVEVGDDLRVTTAASRAWGPALTWTGSGYGLAWWDARDGTDELYFARLDATGAKVGGDVRLTTGGDVSGTPDIVYNGTEYAIAFSDRREGNSEIYLARVDADGVEIGDEVRITTASGSSSLPSLAWNGSGYGLGWEDSRTGSQEQWFTRLDGTGGEVGSAASLGARLFSPWNLVWNGAGYGLALHSTRDGDPEVYAVLLDATGAKTGPDLRLTRDPAQVRSPSIAWDGSGHAVAWADLRDGNWEIYFARVCP